MHDSQIQFHSSLLSWFASVKEQKISQSFRGQTTHDRTADLQAQLACGVSAIDSYFKMARRVDQAKRRTLFRFLVKSAQRQNPQIAHRHLNAVTWPVLKQFG